MPVFDNCNVCGCRLRSEYEEVMGMCEPCAFDWQDDLDALQDELDAEDEERDDHA